MMLKQFPWFPWFVLTVLLVLAGASQGPQNGVIIDLSVPGAVDAVCYGVDANDFLGTDLGTGDINGDGIDDLAAGAYGADGPNNARDGAGAVLVFFGRSNWSADGCVPDVTVHGEDASDFLGGSTSRDPGHIASGDIDGDGIDDLIVSAPFHTEGQRRGRVYVIWGSQGDWPDEIDLAAPPLDVTVINPASSDSLGRALAVGDFDGDGTDDVAMSGPGASPPNRLFAGMVYVLFGGTHLRAHPEISLDQVPEDVPLFTAVGPAAWYGMGSYLAIGDVSGDDIPDLVAGSAGPGTVDVFFGGSDVRGMEWDLLHRAADWKAFAVDPTDKFGKSVATGDVSSDTHGDLFVGAPEAEGPAGVGAGLAVVFFGPLPPGQVRNLAEEAEDPGDVTIWGAQGGDDPGRLGKSGAVGDFNGDEVGDVLVGAREENGFGAPQRGESGQVYVIFGALARGVIDLQEDVADITFVGAEADAFTGYVTAGDVNGDDVADMVLGANHKAGPEGEPDAGAVYLRLGEQVLPTPTPTPEVGTPTLTPTATVTPTPTATIEVPSIKSYLPLVRR